MISEKYIASEFHGPDLLGTLNVFVAAQFEWQRAEKSVTIYTQKKLQTWMSARAALNFEQPPHCFLHAKIPALLCHECALRWSYLPPWTTEVLRNVCCATNPFVSLFKRQATFPKARDDWQNFSWPCFLLACITRLNARQSWIAFPLENRPYDVFSAKDVRKCMFGNRDTAIWWLADFFTTLWTEAWERLTLRDDDPHAVFGRVFCGGLQLNGSFPMRQFVGLPN